MDSQTGKPNSGFDISAKYSGVRTLRSLVSSVTSQPYPNTETNTTQERTSRCIYIPCTLRFLRLRLRHVRTVRIFLRHLFTLLIMINYMVMSTST
ncbi:uncharacterized protein BDR25DRAFT_359451 [Lindgomyces ingoldianus]|uniref:Uncharacterized protein n=1 Tax=Lindgomyces ingoldianus TaxID=673940 RepID=A0ACB6QI48_9PLEO|nr:uncharacterized protein BDR25DRAFT_359451 [Lindgomyces ingoldianus]KAF2466556.1 hypothetical protein BDR25DRAFT_359451 [Lindgomyces ingoldianus]